MSETNWSLGPFEQKCYIMDNGKKVFSRQCLYLHYFWEKKKKNLKWANGRGVRGARMKEQRHPMRECVNKKRELTLPRPPPPYSENRLARSCYNLDIPGPLVIDSVGLGLIELRLIWYDLIWFIWFDWVALFWFTLIYSVGLGLIELRQNASNPGQNTRQTTWAIQSTIRTHMDRRIKLPARIRNFRHTMSDIQSCRTVAQLRQNLYVTYVHIYVCMYI